LSPSNIDNPTNISVAKYKEMKTRCNLTESSKKGYGSKRAVLPMMMMMMMMMPK
jgi:hypothetical protein